MERGIVDDPLSKYTKLSIPNDDVREEIEKELNGLDLKESKKDPKFSVSTEKSFW